LGAGKAICDRYVFEEFDGKGVRAAMLAGELGAMLAGFRTLGALYPLIDPNTNQELDPGYLVDLPTLTVTDGVGSVVAPIRIRRTPGAEMVTLTLILYSVTE